MHKIKSIFTLIILLLVVVFAVQNSAIVEIQLLVWSFSWPRALLVVALLATGFVLGLVVSSLKTRE
ncbi:MAG: putative membrane protein [Planctomycetota bacterium]|jgi:putative membrane protein